MWGLSWPSLLVRFGSSPVPLRSARIPLVLWKFLPSHRETSHQPEAGLQTHWVSLRSGGARWVAEKKPLRKGKISRSKLRGYLGGNETVEGQCCAAVLCWRPIQTHKVFCDACITPHPGVALRKQNTVARFCLNVKRVNFTRLDVDICCELEHQDFIISIYLAGGGMPQMELMLLIFLCLGKSTDFPVWQGLFEPQRGRQERQRQKAEMPRKNREKAGGKIGKWKEVVWMRGKEEEKGKVEKMW